MGNSHAQGPQIFNVFETAAAFFFFSFLQKDRNRTNTVGMFNKCQKLKTSSDSIRAQRKGSKKTKLGTQISLATGWSQSQRRTTAPGTNLLCSLLLLLWFLCFKKKKKFCGMKSTEQMNQICCTESSSACCCVVAFACVTVS